MPALNSNLNQNRTGETMKWCRAELALYLIITILGIGSMITACGQKGPLYKAEQQFSAPQANVHTKA